MKHEATFKRKLKMESYFHVVLLIWFHKTRQNVDTLVYTTNIM